MKRTNFLWFLWSAGNTFIKPTHKVWLPSGMPRKHLWIRSWWYEFFRYHHRVFLCLWVPAWRAWRHVFQLRIKYSCFLPVRIGLVLLFLSSPQCLGVASEGFYVYWSPGWTKWLSHCCNVVRYSLSFTVTMSDTGMASRTVHHYLLTLH